MRADAERNRERILEVAGQQFAATGGKASIEDIARAAGVGVGTVHRHFPSKEQLLAAVLVASCVPILAALDDALAGDDPGRGLETFLLAVLDQQAHHRALAEELRDQMDLSPELAQVKHQIRDRVTTLMTRAQGAGEIRVDVGPSDITMLLASISQTATIGGAAIDPTIRARYVRIVLDGLRPLEPTPLPGRSMTFEEMDASTAS
jgi:AcrR family transcriptional regulator